MPIRAVSTDEAGRRARTQLAALVRDLRAARHNACLAQATVARTLGVSRALVGAWESGQITPRTAQLYEWGACVGLEVSLRAFPGGSPLRDAGQLRLLARFRTLVGDLWTWRTEVPVTADPRDRRTFDAVLSGGGALMAVEAIGRLVDAQGQIRPIQLKARAAGVERIVLVLADSRHNRFAVAAGEPTLAPSFPCSPRAALGALRAGKPPASNAIVFV